MQTHSSTLGHNLIAVLLLIGPPAYATDPAMPEPELLELIAEFGETDDETFELVLYYGQRDAGKGTNKPDTKDETGGNQ